MALIGTATRRSEQSGAAAIAAIVADGLATGHATFRDTPHDWERFLASFLMGRGFALVAEVDTSVVAQASASPTSARAVYRGVAEVSIYVSSRVKGRGVGRLLLEKLVVASEHAGYWTLVAQIFPENEASLSLHTALGLTLSAPKRSSERWAMVHSRDAGAMWSCLRDAAMPSSKVWQTGRSKTMQHSSRLARNKHLLHRARPAGMGRLYSARSPKVTPSASDNARRVAIEPCLRPVSISATVTRFTPAFSAKAACVIPRRSR